MLGIEQKKPMIPPPEAELTFTVGELTVVVPQEPYYTTEHIALVIEKKREYVTSAISPIKRSDPTIKPELIRNPNKGQRIQAFNENDFKKIVTILLERKTMKEKGEEKKQESFTVSDIINAVSLTKIQEKVLRIIDDKQKNRNRSRNIEAIKKALIADGLDPSQIEGSNLFKIIQAIQNKLEETDYELVSRYSERVKGAYYVLKKRPLQKQDSKSESATIETPPIPETEKAKILMAAKATLEILSKIVQQKYNDISPNVRIILGHHLPLKASIPDIFGQATDLKSQDDDLKKFLISWFTKIVNLFWNKDPKTINDALGKQIIEKLSCLRERKYNPSQLIKHVEGLLCIDSKQ